MIIDTRREQIQITISVHEVFNLLSGRGLSDEGWKYLAGYFAEWYGDTYLQREQQEQPSK